MRKAISWKRTTALATCTLMFAAAAAGSLATMDFGHASAADNQFTVSTAKGLQEFDGWGLSLSWWATEIGDWTRVGSSGMTKREEILEALYGKSGLNLNIARYNVGGGDDPAHNPEDDPDKAHMSPDRNTPGWRGASEQVFDDGNGNEYTARVIDDRYAFQDENGNDIPWEETPDWKQLWSLDWIQKEHGADGQNDLITEYYTNSPPYWMTISGCSSGGEGGSENLKNDDEHNRAYIDYFLEVYKYLVRQGFILEHLQPMNEPHGGWAARGDQEGWHIGTEQKAELYSILAEEMAEQNLEAFAQEHGFHVGYNVGDECETDTAVDEYNGMSSYTARNGMTGREILDGADRLTYHIYGYQSNNAQQMYRYAKEHGQDLYMSEICYTGSDDNGESEYDPNSLTTGFLYTGSIINAIRDGVDAYVFWQGMEDMVGQMKGGTNYGLIQGVYYTQEQAEAQGVDLAAMGLTYQDYVCAKSYYMSGQYTKYIRPGYQILDVDDNTSIAAISPEGDTLVIVKENNDSNSKSLRYDLDGFEVQSIEKIVTDRNNNWAQSHVSVTGNAVVDSITDHSVTTYVVHGKQTKASGRLVDDSAFVEKGSTDATAEANLTSLKAALEEGGENEELFYASGFHTNGNTDGEAKFYGNTIWANEKGYLGFRFQGTGFGIVATTKGDTGKIDYWFDADPEADAATGTQDMYGNGGTKTQDVLYVVNDPEYEYGWHTVYIKIGQGAHGQYLNVDGIRIFTAHDEEASGKTLKLNSAAGIGGEIKFTYTVEGYDGYTVYPEYLDGRDWTRGEALDTAEAEGTITGIESATVRLRLVAVKGTETEISGERIVHMAKTTEGVLYYADCGTIDPSSLATGAVLGTLQSVSDQAHGADPATGAEWGYTHTLKDGTSAGYYAESEAMTSIWNSKDNTTGSELTYQFAIPEAGTYNVAVGFYGGGSGWGQRQHTVEINSESLTAEVNEQAYTAVFKKVTVDASGTITVKVTSTADAALLSAIVITEENVKIPLYAEGGSSLNSSVSVSSKKLAITADLDTELAKDTYQLTLSDGTTVAYKAGEEGISYTLSSATVGYGLRANLTLTHEDYPGIELYGTYSWDQEGVAPLYYNIDVGYIGDSAPEDAAGNIGAKQSTTKDRLFGTDGDKGSWGRVTTESTLTKDNCYWETNADPTESVGEEKGSGANGKLTYKMTGFEANEALKVEIGGYCHDWDSRALSVLANGSNVGSMTLVKNEKAVLKDVKVTADESGELELQFKSTAGGSPLVSYIKVWKDAEGIPQDKAITTDRTIVSADDEITLRDLDESGVVYVLDESGTILRQFHPEGATQTLNVGELLGKRTASELQFVQAAEGRMASEAVTVGVLDIEVVLDDAYVPDGETAIVRFVPQTSDSVTSITLTTPDGVNYNILEGFYYRAKTNGTYSVTIVSGSARLSKTFTVDTIDELDLNATFSTETWTDGDVTVTLAPTATSGIASVKIDGTEKRSFTATENGEYPVTVTTNAGFTYVRTVTVANIDKAAPELELSVKLTADGVGVNYSATAVSGGKLYVGYNGTEREVTEEESFNFDAEGKYEIYFKNGLGTSTEKFVYYVTYGAEKAQLASVTVGEDGTVSVTEKTRAALTSTLYRAGESAAIESLKAEKAGKYYLDLDNGSEHELLVFYVRSAALGGGTGTSDVVGGSGNDLSAVMYVGIAIGAAALIAGGLGCGLIIMKRRKNR